MANKQSVQLAEYIKFEKVGVGANKTPAIKIHYKRVDTEPHKDMFAQYFVGTLADESKEVLTKLKAGDKFVVVKEEAINSKDPARPFWNLKEFRSADTFVAKPAYAPRAAGTKTYEKKEYDTTGVKVGAARNQAIAVLAAQGLLSANNFLDDIDRLAYEIIQRQAKQEENVRKGIYEDIDRNNLNEEVNNQALEDDEVPF